jgi:ribonuclease-3
MASRKSIGMLQKALGTDFSRPELLRVAVTHPSWVNENGEGEALSNQRLEFLGDAVIETIVTEMIYRHEPDANEGEMTMIRAALVNRTGLSTLASKIGIGEYLYLGRGESDNGGRDRESNLADAFESVVGALFLDKGYSRTRDWLLVYMELQLRELNADGVPGDAKSRLQSNEGSVKNGSPVYRTISQSGPDHSRIFQVEVSIGGVALSVGTGSRKALAEQEAASKALDVLATENPFHA